MPGRVVCPLLEQLFCSTHDKNTPPPNMEILSPNTCQDWSPHVSIQLTR